MKRHEVDDNDQRLSGRRPAGPGQRRPGPMAARQRLRRLTRFAHLSRDRRPGHTVVPRIRSGPGAGAAQLTYDAPGHHHPELSTRRVSGVRNIHGGSGGCVLRQPVCGKRCGVNMDSKRSRFGSWWGRSPMLDQRSPAGNSVWWAA
ncbi:hypothetical protein AHiyo1_48090 [Arthrobacter sp. Hiyo1]|nr:hypothetical protein AHiyo1_48090 [Arthrobacter sp. Hiyo1]